MFSTHNSVALMSRKENVKWPKPTLETWTKPCKNHHLDGGKLMADR